jgi:hypothetical protein
VYLLLDVQPVNCKAQILGTIPGDNTNYQGSLECRWRFLPINELIP